MARNVDAEDVLDRIVDDTDDTHKEYHLENHRTATHIHRIVTFSRIEVLHLFLAKGLHMEEQHLDPDEFLNVERIPFNEMVHRCLNGEIEDAKTVAAVLKAKVQLDL